MSEVQPRATVPRGHVQAALAVLCLAAAVPGLGASTFLASAGSPVRLPLLSRLPNAPQVFSADFTIFTDGQYRPLSYAAVAAARSLAAPDHTAFWQALFLAFHALNAALVYDVALGLARRWPAAALAAAAFALHPVAAVVVGNPVHFHRVMGLTLLLGSALAYQRFRRTARLWPMAMSLLLFGLGLLTDRAVIALPLVLAAWEALLRRPGERRPVWALPHAALAVAGVALWASVGPHPLHYLYAPTPAGAGWHSFMTVMAATEWYGRGWLLGIDLPTALHEVTPKVFSPASLRFWFWLTADAVLLAWALAGLRRGRWAGLGLVIAFAAMLPYLSVRWNATDAYVAWEYLYVPAAGMGLFLGGLMDDALRRPGPARYAAAAVLVLFAAWHAGLQARLHLLARGRATWWTEALRRNPGSQQASIEYGRALLDEGREDEALDRLFCPAVTQIAVSCRVMAWRYLSRGETGPAVIHASFGRGKENMRPIFHEHERLEAAAFEALGALDYAEAELGKALMGNPWDLDAAGRLARVWQRKGMVRAGREILRWAACVDPAFRGAAESLDWPASAMVRPASPGWARFLADYSADAGVRADILRLSERHPRDPIIQMAAASCLIQARQYEAAIRKLDSVLERLPASSRAWSLGSVALRGAGRPAEAYRAAVKAADLEPQHAVPLLNLGVTAAQMGDWAAAAGFFERAVAVAESKEIQAAACYDLGMLHARLGRYEDAARSLERAVRAVPSDAAAHAELGAALMALGRREEAERSLRKSLELDPSNESARKALGTLRGQ